MNKFFNYSYNSFFKFRILYDKSCKCYFLTLFSNNIWINKSCNRRNCPSRDLQTWHFMGKQSVNHRDIKPWRVHDRTARFQPRALRVFENVCTCYLYINMLLSKHRYSINVTQSPFLSRDVPFTIQALQKRNKNLCTKCYIVVLYVYTLTNSILPAILIIKIEEANAPTRNARATRRSVKLGGL